MKKLLFLVLLSASVFGQTGKEQNMPYGVKITNAISANAPFVAVQETGGVINKINKSDLVDVITATSAMTLPATGVVAKIYITLDNNKIYRWTGVIYQELALTDISGKANDNAVVHLAVTETITGLKTFKDEIIVDKSVLPGGNLLILKAGGTTKVLVQENGNLVVGGVTSGIVLNSANNSITIANRVAIANSGAGLVYGSSTASNHRFFSNGSESLIISPSTNNLLTGTTTDNGVDRLQVNGSILGTSFKKSDGTSSQFLKADGSVDSGVYAPTDSPNLTGIPTAPTAVSGTNSTQVATTAFVKLEGDLKLNGTLSANYVPRATGIKTLTNGSIYDDGSRVSIGLPWVEPGYILAANGNFKANGNGFFNGYGLFNGKITGSSFIMAAGLSSQNLLADGSVFDKFNQNISSSTYFQNNTLLPTTIDGMTITPPLAGTYKLEFNTQFNTVLANVTQQGVIDVNALYSNLLSKAVTNSIFPPLTTGSTVLPGVYETVGAVTMIGNITFDAQNNPNAIFILRNNAAFNTGAGATMLLVNGAKASNIFVVSGGAITLGASGSLKGTWLTSAVGANNGSSNYLEGRLFAINSAITNAGTIVTPATVSPFTMGVISTFGIFSGAGAISNSGLNNIIVGDIGTNNGAITGFETATHSGFIYLPNQGASVISFGIYVNGVLSSSSVRERVNSITKEDVILSDVVTVPLNSVIAVKVTNSIGISRFYNRILIITKI